MMFTCLVCIWLFMLKCVSEQHTPSFDTHTGLGDSCRVCHAFHLQAPQLSPVVEFFSHLGDFTPPPSTPLQLHRGTWSTLGSERNGPSGEKAPALPPTSSSSLPPFIEQT